MSATGFITPVDPKAWENPDDDLEKPSSDLWISSRKFHNELIKHFPFAKGDYVQDGGSWQLDTETEIGAEVGLSSVDGFHFTCFKFRGENFVEFILWFRAFVSEQHTLYVFGDWSWERLILTKNTTVVEIKQFFRIE